MSAPAESATLVYRRCEPAEFALANAMAQVGARRMRIPMADGNPWEVEVRHFETRYRACASLLCDVVGAEARVWLNEAVLQSVVDPLLTADEFLALPPPLRLAVLGEALAPLIEGLDGALAIKGAFDADDGEVAGQLVWLTPASMDRPFEIVLELPGGLTEAALKLADAWGCQPSSGVLRQVSTPARLVSACVDVERPVVEGLALGDVLLADACWLTEGKLRVEVVDAGLYAFGQISETELRLESGLQFETQADSGGLVDDAPPDSSADGAGGDSGISMAAVPVRIDFVAGRVSVPIGELDKMGPGYVIELTTAADASVEVCANGLRVGRGELVDVNGRTGVRLIELTGRAVDGDPLA